MLNLYDEIQGNHFDNKFVIEELLFAQYTCPFEEEYVDIWSQSDYLIHVSNGKKTWLTHQGSFSIEAGQAMYIKKGGAIARQYYDQDFCFMIFFISDNLIKSVVDSIKTPQSVAVEEEGPQPPVIRLKYNMILSGYFQSMMMYFGETEKPPNALIVLKLKEFIMNVLTSSTNPRLASYFRSLTKEESKIDRIMEDNFCYNLSVEEYAKLCHRSLSSFKRDFKKHFNDSPKKWLLKKRLNHSITLLRDSHLSVSQIALESGFENLSHFSRVFKEQFGAPPNKFRENLLETAECLI